MDAIKLKGVAHLGKLVVDVPKEFDEKELEIIILSSNENNPKLEEEKRQLHQEKVTRLKGIVGKAKYPDFPISKYDVYDQ